MRLLDELKNQAKLLGRKSCVLTFSPHTREVTHPDGAPSTLSTIAEKAVLLEKIGIDYLAVLPFNKETAAMSSEQFVDDVLMGRLSACEWVMGEDHRFGRERRGSRDFLHRERDRNHITIFTVAVRGESGAETTSSTLIRNLVAEGRMSDALFLLGHPYLVMTERIRGLRIGTRNGFPTLNFERPKGGKLNPPPGIYAAEVTFDDVVLPGALYLGSCPTYGEREVHFEFHALAVPRREPGEGETACLWIHEFIRADIAFENEAALVKQIGKDVNDIKQFFSSRST